MNKPGGIWMSIILLAGLVLFPSSSSAAEQFRCPDGSMSHEATALEAANASVIAGSQVCASDAALGISNAAGAAKQYLRGILCTPDRDNYGGYGPDQTIQRLDSGFALCAATFLKAAQTQGIPVCIKEGARTVAKQNEYVRRGVLACKHGSSCEHPSGIAIDVNTNSDSNYSRLHQAAMSYGLTFYLGFKDKYHFVPQKNGSGCKAGDAQTAIASAAPSLADLFRTNTSPLGSLLNPGGQGGGAQPQLPPQPQLPQQPLSSGSSPLGSFSPTIPPGSGSPSAPVVVGSNTSASDSIDASDSEDSEDLEDGPLSVGDRLLLLAGGVDAATPVEVGTSVPIVVSGKDAAGISSTGGSAVTTSTMVFPTGTSAVLAAQTFTSPDLGGGAADQSFDVFANASSNTLVAALADMKDALLRALSYIHPFSTTGLAAIGNSSETGEYIGD